MRLRRKSTHFLPLPPLDELPESLDALLLDEPDELVLEEPDELDEDEPAASDELDEPDGLAAVDELAEPDAPLFSLLAPDLYELLR